MNNQTLGRAIILVTVCISFALYFVNANATCTTSISNTSILSSTLTSNADYECITNSGSITDYQGIVSNGYYSTINNNGSITASVGIYSTGNSSTINNNGSITASSQGIVSKGNYSTIINNGSIVATFEGIRITGDYNNFINSGVDIVTSGFAGLEVNASYANITNTATGVITGGIRNNGTINTLTNNGTITGNGFSSTGIYNGGTIATLNNAQGGNGATPATTALTLHGNLPTYYNIIIDSATHYGQLSTDGTTTSATTFGIYAGSNVTNRLYSAVLSGVAGIYPDNTSSYISSTTGTYDNMHWTLALEYNSDGVWDLAFTGVSLMQTQTSLAQSAQALRGVYDLQNVSINNNLNNDCNLFDVHGICTSVTGTQNYLSGGVNNDTTSGTLTVAYRVNDHVRIGAYLDQNLNTSNVTGVHLNNGSPAFGAFAVWNANADGLGTQLRVSAGYADKDLTVTRSAVQTSEAGSGTTSLNSYGASAIASYAMAMPGDFIFSPYAGIRYTRVSADGYTEQANVNVTDPLTYSALTQDATTALIGTKWTRHIADNAVAYASIGLEQDLSNNGGTYSASSANIAGLTPITFNPNINHTRPTASIGSYYNLGNTQRIVANLVWSEEAFTTANATSLMITYTAGF
jgi:Autotransporter beta-domain